MDNDDFRRGRATCHKVFGDGIAVLAGDALLTIAFEIAAKANADRRYDLREIIREIAIAAGSQKLIAGQVADLEAEGHKTDRAQLRYIHENKTAAMLTTSVRLGAMSANANAKQLAAITKFGRALGLAFQVIDDILDVTQTTEKLGKSAGKDVAAKKATYPSVIGLEKSRLEARRLTRQAHNSLRSSAPKPKRCTRCRIIFSNASIKRWNLDSALDHVSARFGSISSVTLERNPASRRSAAAKAIIAALSVQRLGAAKSTWNPVAFAGRGHLSAQFPIATHAPANGHNLWPARPCCAQRFSDQHFDHRALK